MDSSWARTSAAGGMNRIFGGENEPNINSSQSRLGFNPPLNGNVSVEDL